MRLHGAFAWFLTFNFINITWVFFRAKEFEDAWKVLKAMFGFSGIVLPQALSSSLGFLKAEGVEFGMFLTDIQGNAKTVLWILCGFIIVLFLKNSAYYYTQMRPTPLKAVLAAAFFVTAFFSLSVHSEFLYFNF